MYFEVEIQGRVIVNTNFHHMDRLRFKVEEGKTCGGLLVVLMHFLVPPIPSMVGRRGT